MKTRNLVRVLNFNFKFKYDCDPEDGLVVLIDHQRLRCQQQGDILNFTIALNNQKNFNLYYGNLICPACEDICQVNKPIFDFKKYSLNFTL